MAKLKDVFYLQMGKTPSRNNSDYWSFGKYNWISIADLGTYQKYTKETKEKISELAVRDCGMKRVPANTVVMSFKLSLGKTAITKESIYTNEAIMAFIPTGKFDVLPDYFYYLFSGKDWSKEKNRAVMGSTLNKSTLGEVSVIVPPLGEQRKIAAVLDKVSDLIEKRRQQLDKLDLLIKSKFVEMFGDPVNNTKKWECDSISDLCKAIYGGGTPSKSHPEYFEGKIPWVSPKDMKSVIITDSIDHITEEAVQNSSTKIVPKGAILMVIRSGILKHTLPVAITAVELTVNQDMKAFIPGERITPEFLMYYFKGIEKNVLNSVRGVTADNIDFKEFQQRLMIVPPIKLQKQFAAFVDQTEKIKTTISESLEKLETLKKALMQEYFG